MRAGQKLFRLQEERIYGGRTSSKLVGVVAGLFFLLAACGLVWGLIQEFSSGAWWLLAIGLVGFLISSALGFLLSGGRDNPGLIEVIWEKEDHVDVVGDPVGTWRAKVIAMFNILERESHGDYAVALRRLHLRAAPEAVQKAYWEASERPSPQTWAHLREVMLRHPRRGNPARPQPSAPKPYPGRSDNGVLDQDLANRPSPPDDENPRARFRVPPPLSPESRLPPARPGPSPDALLFRPANVPPHPAMLLVAKLQDGSLKPEFAEWEDKLSLEPGSLVPVWWPHDLEGQPLSPEDRAQWFRDSLDALLSPPTSPASGSAAPTAGTWTPPRVLQSLLQLRSIMMDYSR